MNVNFAPELFHLYGPFSIQSYGFFIVLGIIITVYAIRRDKRFKQLNLEPVYMNIVIVSVMAACIGGRVLEVISEPDIYKHWYDWFSFWQGGFSMLGAMCGVIMITPLYLKKINVPILPTCDLVAIYAPLLQSIARLGCFTAGCCYGIPTKGIFGVVYTNPCTLAVYGITVHPTQLYSSAILFMIFIFMFFIGQRIFKKPGELFAAYLIFATLERFFVDFWRAERVMITTFFSFHQIVALIIVITTLIFSSTFITAHAENNKS